MIFHIAVCSPDSVLRSRVERQCLDYYARRDDACIIEQLDSPEALLARDDAGERYELCRSVHAEANAVLNYRGSLKDLEGSTVYVTLFPCHDCAKILAQVGVGEVVYLDNKYADTDDGRISRRILDSCGISYRQVIVDVHIGTGGQTQQ